MRHTRRFLLALLFAAVLAPGTALAESDCTDGIDNDADLLVDCLDPSCDLQPCDDGLFCNSGETCQAASCTGGTAVTCDDGVACTVDACNEGTDACDNTPNDAACDDGAFCNGAETCDALLGCQAGTPVSCDDGVACTVDACNEGTDACDNTPNDAACDDGAFCNGAETCDALLGCQAGTPVSCDDGVACTVDACNEGTDACDNTPNDAACDDGAFCNGAETCDALLGCQAGTPVSCDDGVACTVDACNEGTDACDNTPNDAACDDGAFCNGAETCDALLGCQAGTPVSCDDGVACTVDACNEGTDACDNTPNDAACDDGAFCNGAETCDALLGCQAGTPVSCDDGVACTVDACNEGTDACDNTPNDAACDDGAFCNGAETCDALLGCQAGTPVSCDDGVACTVDACNEGTDACDNTPNDAACDDGAFCNGAETCDALLGCQAGTPVSCDDGVACTVDACNEGTDACDNTPNDAACDDGAFCNGAETCDALLGCQAGTPVSCDDGVACTVDACNEGTDACDNTPSNAACSDGQFCNGVETCNATLGCQAGTPVSCDDGVACTVDACNEGTDACDNMPSNAACSDGQFCNGVETCNATLGCQAGTPVSCDDGVACTVDACNEGTDACDNTPSNAACTDGQFCNGVETCNATLGCQAGTPVSCDDGVACTIDACNEGTDACDNTPSNAACSDGQFCNGVETCNATLGCQAGTPVNCADSVACTTDSCNETTDQCNNTPNNAVCNDGQFCNGVETCDALLGCQLGTPVNCGDSVSCTVDSCDEAGDQCVNTANNALCDDGLFCNGAETCNALVGCQAATSVNCNDSVGCTTDTCNETTDTCTHIANNAICDDGLFCNGPETCDVINDCQAGAPVNCGDAVACTTDSCNETLDSCVNAPNNAACDDAFFCNGTEVCDALLGCQAGTAPTCNDGIACTIDACNTVANACVNVATDSLCNDGLFCNGVEVCSATAGCQAGPTVACSDGVGCTVDACDEVADTCSHVPANSLCDNGLFCDGGETCDLFAGCLPGAPVTCNDAITCTVDGCDEAGRRCVNVPANVLCSDGITCNGAETCDVLLGCQPGSGPACDDGIPCTVETCDDVNNVCVSTPDDTLCDDTLFCNGIETCQVGVGCVAGTAIDCADTISCTVDTCNETTDLCENTTDNTLCDNGLYCDGVEICDAQFGCGSGPRVDCSGATVGCAVGFCNEILDVCSATPSDALCDNGLFCDGRERCSAGGACNVGTTVDCSPLTSACGTGFCDEAANACDVVPMNEGLGCDDGDACTPNDTCVAGICVAAGTTCGDGVLDIACGEECDPPALEICDNLIDDDGDNRIDCEDSSCDAASAPTCGATCNDVSACKVIAQDPGKLLLTPVGKDVLKVRGRVLVNPALINPLEDGFRIVLSNDLATIYRAELFPSDLIYREYGHFRFRDRSAKDSPGLRNGLFSVSIKIRQIDANWWYVFKVKALNDLGAAVLPEMTLQIAGVDDVASVTATWIQHRTGWRLPTF